MVGRKGMRSRSAGGYVRSTPIWTEFNVCFTPESRHSGGHRKTSAYGRVGMWRGGVRISLSVSAPFVWRCLTSRANCSVSTPLSSNRTCRFPASGSRTKPHAFTHGTSCPSRVERPIRFVDGSYLKVVRPSAQRAVQLAHQLCGILPSSLSFGQHMDLLNHALDALLRWPVGLDVREVLTVHTRRTLVRAALGISVSQDVFTANLVV